MRAAASAVAGQPEKAVPLLMATQEKLPEDSTAVQFSLDVQSCPTLCDSLAHIIFLRHEGKFSF